MNGLLAGLGMLGASMLAGTPMPEIVKQVVRVTDATNRRLYKIRMYRVARQIRSHPIRSDVRPIGGKFTEWVIGPVFESRMPNLVYDETTRSWYYRNWDFDDVPLRGGDREALQYASQNKFLDERYALS